MKKSVFFFVLGLMFSQSVMACDACGCSISGGIGLFSAYKKNFVRLNWQHASFASIAEYGNGTVDNFHTAELSLRYHFTKRLKVLVHQPFRVNFRTNSDNQNQSLKGLSDTRLLVNYTVFNKNIKANSKLYIELAGGVKLPIGKYNADIHQQNLPENFNIGNGSFGYLGEANFVATRNDFGLIWTTQYQHNGKSKNDYQFGHQLSTNLLAFWEKTISNLKLIPNAGFRYESIQTDTYANKNTVHGTGGSGTFAIAAINFKTKSWLAGFSYAQPISYNYSQGEVAPRGRFSCQISYLF